MIRWPQNLETDGSSVWGWKSFRSTESVSTWNHRVDQEFKIWFVCGTTMLFYNKLLVTLTRSTLTGSQYNLSCIVNRHCQQNLHRRFKDQEYPLPKSIMAIRASKLRSWGSYVDGSVLESSPENIPGNGTGYRGRRRDDFRFDFVALRKGVI